MAPDPVGDPDEEEDDAKVGQTNAPKRITPSSNEPFPQNFDVDTVSELVFHRIHNLELDVFKYQESIAQRTNELAKRKSELRLALDVVDYGAHLMKSSRNLDRMIEIVDARDREISEKKHALKILALEQGNKKLRDALAEHV